MPEVEILRHMEQGSDEWLAARAGLPTASALASLLVKPKGKDAPHGLGAGAVAYAYEVAGEILTGAPAPSFSNSHTERGHELEPQIRADYELLRGVEVEQVGLIRRGRFGYSPDGLVGDDGLIEIKSRLPKILIPTLLGGPLSKDEDSQIQGGLWASGRAWCDYIAYYPGMPMCVRRVYRDDAMISQIEDAVGRFNAFVDEIVGQVKAAA